MAITRAQQVKQMLQNGGMLVQPRFGGTRQGYRSAKAQEVQGRTKTSGFSAPSKPGQSPRGTTTDQSSPERDTGLEKIRQRNITKLDEFKEYKPPVKKSPGFLGFFNKPFQKLNDLTTARNRKFFENVIRAGKIPRLNFANLDSITPKELEDIYQDYMDRRLKGEIDAMGNPLYRGDDDKNIIPIIPKLIEEEQIETPEYVNPLSLLTTRIAGSQFAADGGRIGLQEGGGIEQRLEQLGGDVSSAEQVLQAINKRLETAESSLGSGGGISPDQFVNTPAGLGIFAGRPILTEMPGYQGIQPLQKPLEELKTADPNNLLPGTTVPTGGTFNGMPLMNQNPFDQMSPAEKVKQVQNRMMQQDIKSPEVEAFFSEVIRTQGNTDKLYPTSNSMLSRFLPMPRGGEVGSQGTSGVPALGYAEGGIANLDREAFLLGGLAKGLKKAVRGVKKLAKSPLGKAALIGAGFGLADMGPFKGLAGTSFGKGLAGLRGTLFGQAGSRVGEAFVPYKEGLFTKLGLTKGGGSLIPTFKGGITLASILPLLVGKTDEEKDQILKDYYASQELSPATTARQAGSEFDFYQYNLAEGGTPRKEPVAKKVMPLLDMDGMEKDYRAEGGFVPIGRMEKADDVPARLSKNEFVFTADAVRNAGEGDIDKGAEVMYNMMKNLEAGGEVSEESQGLDGAREMFQTSQRLGEVI